MALVPCPACGLPRAADADTACPACRWADTPPLPQPVPTTPPTPAPEPDYDPAPPRGPLALAGAGGLAVGVVATLLFAPTEPPAPTPEPEVTETAPAPNPYPRVPSPPVAPPPRAVEPVLEPVVVPVPYPVDGGFAVLKVGQADELFHFPSLGPGNRVKLVGRAKRFTLDAPDAGTEVDATGLENDSVAVAGVVGGATLRLKSAGGTVLVRSGVAAGSVVEIDAPKALVTFVGDAKGGKAGPAVGGGSKVTVRAKSVVFGTAVTGAATVVDVTFSPGGSLKLEAVEDGALVRYRPGHRADQPVKVTRGRVAGGEVREEPPP